MILLETETEKALYEAASRRYRAGFSCAESILRTFCEELTLNVTADAQRVAAGFGGGIYSREGPCGAATGGVMVLGLLAGRSAPGEDKQPMKILVRDFIDRFIGRFGALGCGCLNPYETGTPPAREVCHTITAETAVLLWRFIQERGLYRCTGSSR